MKRVLLIVAVFLAGSFQNAEAFRLKYQNVVRDGNGLIVKGATVSAVKAGTATAVNTYATSTATSAVTVTTDSSGVYTIYFDALENGSEQLYDLSISTSYASFSSKNIKPTPVTGTYTISTSQTANYPVFVPYGVTYSIASGKTLTFTKFEGPGLNQVFSCVTSTCIGFSSEAVTEVRPEWWGTLAIGLKLIYDSGYYSIVNVESYGNSIARALTTIGTSTVQLNISSSVTLTGNLTTPANVSIYVKKPGLINYGSNTLTINSHFDAGLYNIFSGTGTVIFGTNSAKSIYPQWWGAKADGTTDDSLSIQYMLNSLQASGGGHAHFPKGKYSIKSKSYDATRALALTFASVNMTQPLVITGDHSIISHETDSNVITMELYGKAPGTPAPFGVDISGLTFVGTRIPSDTDIEATQNNHLLYLDWFKDVKIHDCTFKNNNGSGIYYYGTDNLIVSNNTFINSNGGVQGIASMGISIINSAFTCTVKCDDQIAAFGTSAYPSKYVVISGNNIDKGYDGLKGTGATRRAWGRGIVIGDYVSHVNINGNVIQNVNSDNSTDRSGAGLYGLGGIEIGDSALVPTSDITIVDNTIRNTRIGITGNEGVSNYNVHGNTLSDIEKWAINLSSGVTVTHAKYLSVTDNVISNCGNSTDTGIPAIGLYYHDNILISGNNISDSDVRYGINIVGTLAVPSSNVSIINNAMNISSAPTESNISYGIILNGTSKVKVNNNVINFPSKYSLYSQNADTTQFVEINSNVLSGFSQTNGVSFAESGNKILSSGNYEIPYGEDFTGRNTGLKRPRADNIRPTATLRSTAMPTSGYYFNGDTVQNEYAVESGSGGSKYVLLGWRRIVSGTSNTLNTDWVEMRALTGN